MNQSTIWARITWGTFRVSRRERSLEARLLVQIVNQAGNVVYLRLPIVI